MFIHHTIIHRRSASPESGAELAAGENPFKNYRSFDEFRSNKQQPAGETSTDRWHSTIQNSYPRQLEIVFVKFDDTSINIL